MRFCFFKNRVNNENWGMKNGRYGKYGMLSN